MRDALGSATFTTNIGAQVNPVLASPNSATTVALRNDYSFHTVTDTRCHALPGPVHRGRPQWRLQPCAACDARRSATSPARGSSKAPPPPRSNRAGRLPGRIRPACFSLGQSHVLSTRLALPSAVPYRHGALHDIVASWQRRSGRSRPPCHRRRRAPGNNLGAARRAAASRSRPERPASDMRWRMAARTPRGTSLPAAPCLAFDPWPSGKRGTGSPAGTV